MPSPNAMQRWPSGIGRSRWNEKLRQLLCKAQGFDAKSERLARLDPDQLNLALEDIELTIARAEAIEEKAQAAPDGYAPYKKLPADKITIACCWSHLRREFFKIAERGDSPIATEAVACIA